MSISRVITVVLIPSFIICATLTDNSEVGLNTVQMIKKHGYVCENHKIITEDGYILTYQRIPHGLINNGPDEKPAVLLMHGLLASSTEYVDMGPKDGFAYILADLGYDVWLANARGTPWSRKHKTLNIIWDKKKFFDFSWHEIGYYDLPAAIDHILNVTKLKSLYYIGHSQGGTAFLVFASMRPEYAQKIELASLVAPGSFMSHYNDIIFKPLAEYVYEYENFVNKYKMYEFPFVRMIQKWESSLCVKSEYLAICRLVFYLSGENQFTPEIDARLPVILSHYPTEASTKQMVHYGQLVRNGGFRQYDYGVKRNRQIYGQEFPPSYNLSQISVPVAVWYSKGDRIVNYKDVKMLIERLPNVVYEYFGPASMGHNDFIFVKDLIDPIDGKLIKVLKNYSLK